MWPTLLFITTIFLFLLPLLPGFIELRLESDARPLRVVQEYDIDITYFALGFKQYLKRNFINFFTERTNTTALHQGGVLRDLTHYQIIHNGTGPKFDTQESSISHTAKLILSQLALNLPGNMFFEKEIYSANTLTTGDNSQFRAILAEGDIVLGEHITVFRWIHSGGILTMGKDCALYGRASAEKLIAINENCLFERINAPVIQFGPAQAITAEVEELTPVIDLPNVIDQFKNRWLVSGDSDIPEKHSFEGDLIAKGNIHIGQGSSVIGSLKSNKKLILDKNAKVSGAVICTGDIYIAEGCQIAGPIIAEGSLFIAPGCVIGSENSPTTVTGQIITVMRGVTVYGTVWADKHAQLLTGEVA